MKITEKWERNKNKIWSQEASTSRKLVTNPLKDEKEGERSNK